MIFKKSRLQEGVLNIPFYRIFCYVLTNLQFALKFICFFVIREGALLGDEVEDGFAVTVLTDVPPNQLRIPHHAPDVWPALKKKIPLASYLVHLFPLKCLPNTLLVNDINHGFEQEIHVT